jgi:hypothetical protein
MLYHSAKKRDMCLDWNDVIKPSAVLPSCQRNSCDAGKEEATGKVAADVS